MMNKKTCLIIAPLLLSGLLIVGEAQAQFDKYRAKTSVQKESKKSSIKDILNQQNDDATSGDSEETSNAAGTDDFGRQNAVAPKGPEASKYVNLNPETGFGPEVITSFDFPNTQLIDMVKHMQKLTGINLIYDDKLKGKVNISAPTPITVGDAWKAFETVLAMNGYYLVESGSFYRIVDKKDIKYTKTKIYTGNFTPDTSRFVMKVISLKSINAKSIERVFRPFATRDGRIYHLEGTNSVVIQDEGTNINRLMKLIQSVDVPGHEESLQIVKVHNSSAQEIVAILDKILKGSSPANKLRQQSAGSNVASIEKVTAEPRTNSIIAMTNAAGAEQLRDLIKKLDVKMVSSGSGQIHVYYLNHGDAESLSKTLGALVSGSSSKAGATRFTSPVAALSSGSGNALFSNQVKVDADKNNNALVITASPTDYLILKEVISKLDIPRDQVYVEGLIMETSVSNQSAYGISVVGGYGTGNMQRAGFTGGSNDLISMVMGTALPLNSFFAGTGFGGKVTQTMADGSTKTINSVNALITAIAGNSNSNVLATPQIMTMDNEEGVFEAGEQVPYAEKTDAANGSSSNTVKMQKVTMTLKILPQINKVSRTIKLKIDQKLDDFSGRKIEGAADQGAATVTRSIITHVTAKDKETVAMGGLMRDKTVDVESKVPLLGDIPVLGWLFKHKSHTNDKMNLLFFLTPQIVASKDKSTSKNVRDLLNRRSLHLQEAVEDDPAKLTVKGLYEKAKRSEEESAQELNEFERNNMRNETPSAPDSEEEAVPEPSEEDSPELELTQNDSPNYQQIIQKVNNGKAAAKKR